MRAILAFSYYLAVFVGMLILGCPYIIYKKIINKKEETTDICKYFFKNIIFKIFHISVSVQGSENIPQNTRGFVIIANHQSFLDTNVIWHSIANSAFMAKASLWKAPIFGWVLNSVGCIPVFKTPRKNLGMGKLVKNKLDKGYNLTVFPEGHRTEDGHMLKFQNGIFRMAKEQHFDILPITLINTGEHLPKIKWAVFGGEVKIVVHPLVTYEQYQDKPMSNLRDEMHNLIESVMPYKQAEQTKEA